MKSFGFTKKILKYLVLALILTSCTANSDSGETTNATFEQPSGEVSWKDPSTLLKPISETIAEFCPSFVTEDAVVAFGRDYEESNLRTYEVDGAVLFVYLDGAMEPDIEDEVSTTVYYEKWGCTKDTLFINELRFSDFDYSGKSNPVFVFDCVDEHDARPVELIITCADANMGVRNIMWDSWNTLEASGKGEFFENDCEPDCASGLIIRQAATIQLIEAKTDKFGKRVFSQIVITTDKKQQRGGYMDTYSLYYEE